MVISLHHCVRRARVSWLKRNSAETATRRGNAQSSHTVSLTPSNLFLLCFFSSPHVVFLSPHFLCFTFISVSRSRIRVLNSSLQLCYHSYLFLPKQMRPDKGHTKKEGFTTPLGLTTPPMVYEIEAEDPKKGKTEMGRRGTE